MCYDRQGGRQQVLGALDRLNSIRGSWEVDKLWSSAQYGAGRDGLGTMIALLECQRTTGVSELLKRQVRVATARLLLRDPSNRRRSPVLCSISCVESWQRRQSAMGGGGARTFLVPVSRNSVMSLAAVLAAPSPRLQIRDSHRSGHQASIVPTVINQSHFQNTSPHVAVFEKELQEGISQHCLDHVWPCKRFP